MARLLTPEDLDRQLAELPDWRVDGGRLLRTVKAPSFLAGIDLVVAVAAEAEDMDHHPDIDVRWRDITFALSTHSAGGLTRLDVDLAHRIDQAVARVHARPE